MKTIRWGIIGCGDVTEVKSGPGFAKAAHSQLLAVMRRDGARAADYARRHAVPRWHDDAGAIIDAPDIDAVYIATPPASHHGLALRCAAARKPTLVEKPMALDHAECVEMQAAFARAGVPLWVAYYRRALPRFTAVRDLLRDGAIGDVRTVMSRQFQPLKAPARMKPGSLPWRIDPAISGGGLFVDMMSHTLDFLDSLFGPIEAVRAFADNKGNAYAAEDTVNAIYRFASGVQGAGTFCYAADRDEEFNEIVGSTGRIVFSTTQAAPIRVLRGNGEQVEELAIGDPPHVHQPLIQSIVDELNGIGRCPSTGESGARTTWAVDRILAEFRDAVDSIGRRPA